MIAISPAKWLSTGSKNSRLPFCLRLIGLLIDFANIPSSVEDFIFQIQKPASIPQF